MSCHMPNMTAHFIVDLTKMAGVKWSVQQSKLRKTSVPYGHMLVSDLSVHKAMSK